MQRLDPRFAFISCGAGNRYGHPHSETLQRLKNHSVRYWTTEQNGALRLSVKGEKIKIVTYR